ncbi:MAG: NUDIX pyrophosphatase [Planctomycetes bacterium]|jgi:dATP pyrophosphohydrolase|nr:NUDIX pyrophosphatase [Planctomycetota bacterium]
MKTKTNNQVEVIIFKKTEDGIKYLMLKRNAIKGSFWQPITGNVEVDETFEQAAVRELREETGIDKHIRLFDTGYSFEFFDDNRQQLEKVYAVEISLNTDATLSEEHTEMQWATKEECLGKYLKYPGNKAGLKTLAEMLEAENG